MLPEAPDPAWPRYSTKPFPPYRFVPGRAPHPRRDPKGHAYGTPEPKPPPVDPARWRESDIYLFGIDLYNFAYWWECHEALEALWHAVGHTTRTGQFLQGIIQVSAANLKRFVGQDEGAKRLWAEGLARLRDAGAAASRLRPSGSGVATPELAEGEQRRAAAQARHDGIAGVYMGVDVDAFARDVEDYFGRKRDTPALIRLQG